MSKIKKTKTRSHHVPTKTFEDAWSAQKAKIEELAAEQVRADILLVEANRASVAAAKQLAEAQAKKTTAEKKLATFRANLGES